MKRAGLFGLAVLAAAVSLPAAGKAAEKSEPRVVPWNMAQLSRTPKIHPTDECPAPGMRAFFYEGADYKGKPTWVFAYYAAPEGTPPLWRSRRNLSNL